MIRRTGHADRHRQSHLVGTHHERLVQRRHQCVADAGHVGGRRDVLEHDDKRFVAPAGDGVVRAQHRPDAFGDARHQALAHLLPEAALQFFAALEPDHQHADIAATPLEYAQPGGQVRRRRLRTGQLPGMAGAERRAAAATIAHQHHPAALAAIAANHRRGNRDALWWIVLGTDRALEPFAQEVVAEQATPADAAFEYLIDPVAG